MALQAWDFVRPAVQQAISGPGAPPPPVAPAPAAPDAPGAAAPEPGAAMSPVAPEPSGMASPMPPGAPSPMPAGPPSPMGPGLPSQAGPPAAGPDLLISLLQALQQRQVPPLPAPAPASAGWPPSPQQPDALGLLRVILGNQHLQQALQPSGAGAPRTMQLPIPVPSAPRRMRSLGLPLRDVMSAIIALAGESIAGLNAGAAEDEGEAAEYLVGEDGQFVVDPTDPDDRAALIALLFQVNDEAERTGAAYGYGVEADERVESDESDESDESEDTYAASGELSESDEWALDAGFRM